MEAASMVVRTLTGLTGGLAAGVVLGAALPILIPSRTDSMEVRMASCVLASLILMARPDGADKRSKPVAAAAPVEVTRVAA
jgi:phosphate acetyltransferase